MHAAHGLHSSGEVSVDKGHEQHLHVPLGPTLLGVSAAQSAEQLPWGAVRAEQSRH